MSWTHAIKTPVRGSAEGMTTYYEVLRPVEPGYGEAEFDGARRHATGGDAPE